MKRKILRLVSSYLYIFAVMYITQTLQGDRLTLYIVGVAALVGLEIFTQRQGQGQPTLYHNLGLGFGMLTYLLIFLEPFSRRFWNDSWIFALVIGLIFIVPRLYSRQKADQEREKQQSKFDDPNNL